MPSAQSGLGRRERGAAAQNSRTSRIPRTEIDWVRQRANKASRRLVTGVRSNQRTFHRRAHGLIRLL